MLDYTVVEKPAGGCRLGNCYYASFFWAAAILGVWILVRICLKLLAPLLPQCTDSTFYGVKHGTWALKITMLFHHIPISLFVASACLEDPLIVQAFKSPGDYTIARAMLRNDNGGPSRAAEALIPVTIGYMIADLLLFRYWQLASKGGLVETILMFAHHGFSIHSWGRLVPYDYGSRYLLLLQLSEISSVFLTINWFLSTSGNKNTLMYKISGILFTFAFVIIRMIGAIPQLIGLYTACPRSHILPGVHPQTEYLWWLPFVPHFMNFFWGYKVIKGFLAVIFPSKKRSA